MTSSSTLALDTSTKSPKNASTLKEELTMDNLGMAELLQPLLVAFAWAFDAQQAFISVFTDAGKTWQCLEPTDRTCHAASSPCHLRRGTWAWSSSPSHSSTISEWELDECSGNVLSSLPTTCFFVGCFVGGLLFSTLADSVLGRKKLLVLSCLIMSLFGGLAALSPNVWVYCLLRFVSGFGRSSIGSCSLVLSSEIANKRCRDAVSVSGFFFFTLGFLSLPGLAYARRRSSWRFLYLYTCAPAFGYAVLIHFTVQESPRWLSARAHMPRNDNARRRIYDAFSSMKTLVTTRSTLLKLVAVMMASSGIGMVFYGMPLAVGSLGPNLYLSIAYNALADLPTSVLSYFLVVNVNRRIAIVALTMFSGIASLICVFRGISSNVQLAAEVICFFCACMATDVTLVYSVELFPTCIRNSALSLVRQAILLGGTLAPILVAEGRRRARFWSFGVFGIVVCCCGLFVVFLPETRGKDLTDNIEEGNLTERPCNTP